MEQQPAGKLTICNCSLQLDIIVMESSLATHFKGFVTKLKMLAFKGSTFFFFFGASSSASSGFLLLLDVFFSLAPALALASGFDFGLGAAFDFPFAFAPPLGPALPLAAEFLRGLPVSFSADSVSFSPPPPPPHPSSRPHHQRPPLLLPPYRLALRLDERRKQRERLTTQAQNKRV